MGDFVWERDIREVWDFVRVRWSGIEPGGIAPLCEIADFAPI